MRQFKSASGAIAIVGSIALAMAVATPQSAPGQAPNPVVVMNPNNQPVPVHVRGVTTVDGTVTTNQGGVWTVRLNPATSVSLSPGTLVGLAGGTSVAVNNPPSDPVPVRDVDAPTEIFQAEESIEIPLGVLQGSVNFGTVPVGRRLVIEQVSAMFFDYVLLATPHTPPSELSVRAGNTRHFLIPVYQVDSDWGDVFVVHHQMRMYANAGEAVQVFIKRRLSNGNAAHATATISGYYVQAP